MGTPNRKKTALIIIGSIIFVLAILIAVGPSLVMKYMRAKWQDGPKYKVSSLLMTVKGTLKISSENTPYLVGDNGLFYVLEDTSYDLKEYDGLKCSVIAKIRQPENSETIEGNPVRLFLGVNKINFLDSDVKLPTDTVKPTDEELAEKNKKLEAKSLAKAQLRVKANTILNKPILFDVIKGDVANKQRKDLDGKDYTAVVLTDEFGDNYMLYKNGKDLSGFAGKNIICLGREIIPPSNMPLVVDETTFEIYEIYDENYNRLM